jgi:(p)ppGpp synthase/HD superfamily hydrolase
MKDIARAREFARKAHRNQTRKYTGLPYVDHVIAVSAIVAAHGGDDNQIIAALECHNSYPYTCFTTP